MSGATRQDVFRLIGFIEDDLRGINAKFTQVRSMLAAGAMSHGDDDGIKCERCGIVLASERALLFHLQNVHDGPPVPLSEAEEAA